MMANPFRAMTNIRRHELPLALLMFSYFFLVIASFWILKPIKKSLFIQYYDGTGVDIFSWHMLGSQAELIAKVLNMVVAFLAVTVFTLLARRFRRQQLTMIFTLFFMASYAVFGRLIDTPGDGTVWTFYLFGDLFTTLMVATFFAFLNDSVTPESAKRLYGLVGFGGVLGGVFGSSFVRVWIDSVSRSSWLWICFGIGAVIIVIARAAGRIVDRQPPPVEPKPEPRPVKEEERPKRGGNAALEGARLVFRSPYLLSIVANFDHAERVNVAYVNRWILGIFEVDLADRTKGFATSKIDLIASLVRVGHPTLDGNFVLIRLDEHDVVTDLTT